MGPPAVPQRANNRHPVEVLQQARLQVRLLQGRKGRVHQEEGCLLLGGQVEEEVLLLPEGHNVHREVLLLLAALLLREVQRRLAVATLVLWCVVARVVALGVARHHPRMVVDADEVQLLARGEVYHFRE